MQESPPGTKVQAEALLPLFKTGRLLNQDQDGRRVALLGSINTERALLVIERAPFTSDVSSLSSIPSSLAWLQNLGSNDVYRWYLGSIGTSLSPLSPNSSTRSGAVNASSSINDDNELHLLRHPDIKLNLFYPASDKHIRKYSAQRVRLVRETPAIYRELVRPWIESRQRQPDRIRWIYDILDGKAEAEDVIYRSPTTGGDGTVSSDPTGTSPLAASSLSSSWLSADTGFVLLPDLNWDRRTVEALHLLALVQRRDLWSVRDLKKSHVPELRQMRAEILRATVSCISKPKDAGSSNGSGDGNGAVLEEDQLKLYVHYQPTYYHLHVHVVHVALDGGSTQAIGKAIGLDSIIDTLELLPDQVNDQDNDKVKNKNNPTDGEPGMHQVPLTYHVGEESELWRDIWEPLKKREQAEASLAEAP